MRSRLAIRLYRMALKLEPLIAVGAMAAAAELQRQQTEHALAAHRVNVARAAQSN